MAKRVSKQRDGKVVAENLIGRPIPRARLVDQTGGKSLGTRNVRSVGGRSVVNFARRGRS